MSDLAQKVSDLYGFSSFVLVQGTDINNCNHFIKLRHWVIVNEYFSISLLKVKNLLNVIIKA